MAKLRRFLASITATSIVCVSAIQAYPRQSEISLGRKFATEADCAACHTAKGGPAFAGGEPISTPFGTIYGKNITFDKGTGIGTWSEQQFWHALHDGIDDGGNHIYPAMPYNYFTKMPRWQVDAIYAFLKAVPKVHRRNKPNTFGWPYDWRWLMVFWNWLFFDHGVFHANPKQSAAYNHGAYLVEGPGHCGACHTPTGFLGSPQREQALEGNDLGVWWAPSLVAGNRQGLGTWSKRQLVQFLKTGTSERTAAFGPMSDVIRDSTSKMSERDLEDIATFLLAQRAPEEKAYSKPSPAVLGMGKNIYDAQCAACHTQNGSGQSTLFASLKGDPLVQSRGPQTVIHVILTGVAAVHTQRYPTAPAMPAFDWKLDDRQIAAVADYIRSAWGNSAPAVSSGQVRSLRRRLGAE